MPDNNSIKTDNSQFTTPILFLIFNRPDTTKKVFGQIRAIKPKYLFISADGPRENIKYERNNCEAARKIVSEIDWNCELKTNFLDVNQGCKIGVSSGINWFFNQVSEGIVLEDDCFPDLSFFSFCQILLEHYRDNEKIMHIGGINFQDGKIRGTGSYYFSKLNHIWGWASWKRAWNKYDVNISLYPKLIKEDRFSDLFPNPEVRRYWQKNFDLIYAKKKDTWDVQWQFAMTINDGLAIYPNVNLISNIGFDTGATHTVDTFHPLANIRAGHIEVISHPAAIDPDARADMYTFRKYLSPNRLVKLWYIARRKFA
jgi:hypothetical protein